MQYRSADLFAGIGGIRLGFDQAFKDIETVFVSEWDKFAAKTYVANFGDEPKVSGDITKIAAEDIPEFDICLAGFPCQPFSKAGKGHGFEDNYNGQTRGTLFAEVVRICDYHKPKVIFCENVKGLYRHDKGRTFEVITKSFEEIGYKVFSTVLNSKNFGVAQNRERVYIVCFRKDIAPEEFVFPTQANSPKTIQDILEEAPIPAKYYLSEQYLRSIRDHKARHQAKGHGFGYTIRDLNGVSGTLVCSGSGREGNLIIDHREHSMQPTTKIKSPINSEDIRSLTPREWARLQGFPENFKLVVSDTQLFKQFGNSVSVPVIKAIAKNIEQVLEKRDALSFGIGERAHTVSR